MRKTMFMASAALGAMTAAERQMGRYMRAPDHPAPAAPAPAAEPAPAPEAAAPEPAPAAPAKAQTTDDIWDKEFGGVTLNESGEVEPPAPAEPAEPEAAPAEPEGAADQQPKPDDKPATPSLEDRLAAAEAAAEEARREARELREQMQAPKPKSEQQPEPQEPNPEDGRPNPKDYEFGEADSEYITALAEWTADKRFEQRMAERDQQQQQKADYAEMQSNWDAQISAPEVAEQYPDFQQKVVEGADRGDWHCSPVMTVAIKSSPVGRDVAYELANNAAESKRIAALHPSEQVLEMGRLEGKFLYLASQRQAAADPNPTPTPAPVKPSNAPNPPPARARGAGGKFETELDQTYDRMLTEFK